MESDASIKHCGVSVLKGEADALLCLSQHLDDGFMHIQHWKAMVLLLCFSGYLGILYNSAVA